MSSATIHNQMNQISSNLFPRAKSGLKPIRLHQQRLLPDKIANTGEDPKGKYLEFIKHDIIKPLTSKTVLKKEENKFFETCNAKRWALNTAKICSSRDLLPKLQPFKEYNFQKVDPLKEQQLESNQKKTYFKTDHISVKVPVWNNENKRETFLEKKTKYCHNSTTYSNGWNPRGDYKTITNRSSVTYNILNNDNKYSMAASDTKIMDIKLFNRKKCIGEFEDLNHVFHPNFSEKYNSTLNENPSVYKTFKGVFTNMYDAANRNGNIIEVFKKTLVKKDEKKEKNNSSFGNSINNKNKNFDSVNSNRNNNNNFASQSVITKKSSRVSRSKNNSDNIAKVMSHDRNPAIKGNNSPKK